MAASCHTSNQPQAAKNALDFCPRPKRGCTINGEEAASHDVKDGGKLCSLGEVGVVCGEDVSYIRGVAGDEQPHPAPNQAMRLEVVA